MNTSKSGVCTNCGGECDCSDSNCENCGSQGTCVCKPGTNHDHSNQGGNMGNPAPTQPQMDDMGTSEAQGLEPETGDAGMENSADDMSSTDSMGGETVMGGQDSGGGSLLDKIKKLFG